MKQKMRRLISLLLAFLIGVAAFPSGIGQVSAEETYAATFYIDMGSVIINETTASGYDASGNPLSVPYTVGSKYLITQHQDLLNPISTPNNISISGNQDVTLRYIYINNYYYEMFDENPGRYALMINKNSAVKLTIDTMAKLLGGNFSKFAGNGFVYYGYAGLQVDESSSVDIYGMHGDSNTDYLTACGNAAGGAGIGGGYGSGPIGGSDGTSEFACRAGTGNITIHSGNIYAEVSSPEKYELPGTSGGAGIGCGRGTWAANPDTFKSITILGGVVTAYGGINSCGIGQGYGSSDCGAITIQNAKVFAGAGKKVAIDSDVAAIGGGSSGTGVEIKSGTVDVRQPDSNGKYTQNGIIGMSGGYNYISGGTILHVSQFYGKRPTVSDTDNRNVYPAVITLPDEHFDKRITSLSVSQNGQAYPYGSEQIYTTANMQLYPYLPLGATSIDCTYQGMTYTNFHGVVENIPGSTSVLKMDQLPLSITGLASQYTYGDAISVPGVLGGSTSGTLTGAFTGRDGTSYNSSSAPTNVGKYTYTVTMTGNDSYYAQTADYDFEILPKTISFSIDGIASQTYSGNAITPDVTVKDGTKTLIKDTDYTVKYTDNINTGTANVTVTGKGNYANSTGTSSFTINPISTTLHIDSITDQTYTGSSLTPDVIVKDGAKTLTKDTDYSVKYTNNINTGTANVSVTGKENYSGSSGTATFMIQKKEIVVNLSSSGNGAYAGADVGLTAKIAGAVDLPKGSIQFKYGSQVIDTKNIIQNSDGAYEATAVWSSVPSGIYTLTATYVPQNNDNYIAKFSGCVSNYSVIKQDQQVFSFSENTITKTYGDNDFTLSTLGGSGSGMVTYSVSGGSDVVALSGNEVTIRKAGTAVITAVKTGDTNYNETSATITIHVKKAQSSILLSPTAADITAVAKLSTVKLAGGKGSVGGAFTWVNPNLIVSAAGEYDVMFTPIDLGNYLPCTGKVKIKVNPILVSSSADVVLDLSEVTLPSGVTSISLGSSQFGNGSTSYHAVFKLINDNTSLGGLEHLMLYDMKLLDQNGNPVENFTGKIKVKVKIPPNMSGNLHVYWYNPVNNALTDMSAVQENGYLVFETTHFSFYTIAQLSATSSGSTTQRPNSNPDTGSKNYPVILLTLFCVGLIAVLTVVKRQVKVRMYK